MGSSKTWPGPIQVLVLTWGVWVRGVGFRGVGIREVGVREVGVRGWD